MKLPTPLALVWKSLDGLANRNGIEIAGYIAFTVMLSLFPFMIFLVSVAGFFGNTRTGEDFLNTVSLFAPPDVMKTLQPAILEVIQNRSGSLLTIGLALSLYSASSAVSALRLALDLAYGVEETRSFWWRKVQDFLIVMVGSVILILTSVAIILGPWVWGIVARFTFLNPKDQSLWHLARYAFAMISLALGIIGLHRVLPNCKMCIRQILPGALTTTIIWIIAASALPLYFGRFANYTATYGSLGGVIVTLMFFYVSAIIFIFGGEFNAALMARVSKAPPPPNPEVQSLPAKA
ncbi:MAG: YihY/virulence factor BrkB family protein [Rhodospirillales bacterium]|nr:YihY/virulence factor BrkB family protein [Rhodospirillales bacterium]